MKKTDEQVKKDHLKAALSSAKAMKPTGSMSNIADKVGSKLPSQSALRDNTAKVKSKLNSASGLSNQVNKAKQAVKANQMAKAVSTARSKLNSKPATSNIKSNVSSVAGKMNDTGRKSQSTLNSVVRPNQRPTTQTKPTGRKSQSTLDTVIRPNQRVNTASALKPVKAAKKKIY